MISKSIFVSIKNNYIIQNKLVKGSFWALTGKLSGVVLGLIVSSLLTHLLSPQELGAYYVMLSIVAAGETVAQLGLPMTLVRLIAEAISQGKPEKAKLIIIKITKILFFSLVINTCLLSIFGQKLINLFSVSAELSHLLPFMVIWIILITLQDISSEIFRGYFDIRLSSIIGNILTGLFSLIFFSGLWLIQKHSNLLLIIILTIISGTLTIIFASIALYKKINTIPLDNDEILKVNYLLRISSVMWLVNILLYIWAKIDIWIMGIFTSPDQVAIYGSALRLIVLISFPYVILSSIISPYIAEMNAKKDFPVLENGLKIASTLGAIPSLIMFIFVVVFGQYLLRYIFGEFYIGGYTILIILCFGQLINIMAGFCGEALLFTGHQSAMLKVSIMSSIITFLISYSLVTHIGGIGVAIGITIGNIFQNMVCLLLTKKYLGIWTNFNLVTFSNLLKRFNYSL